jgi:hypothetical protein
MRVSAGTHYYFEVARHTTGRITLRAYDTAQMHAPCCHRRAVVRVQRHTTKRFTVSLSRELERETFQLRLTPALELETSDKPPHRAIWYHGSWDRSQLSLVANSHSTAIAASTSATAIALQSLLQLAEAKPLCIHCSSCDRCQAC